MADYFKEAMEFLQSRKPVDKETYKQMEYTARMKAFTVGGYTSLEVLQEFLEQLQEAVRNGTTKEQFREDMNQFLESNGYTGINPWKSDNIFRTNLQTAFNAGHYKAMTDEAVLKLRPYWQYKTAGDSEVRPDHALMADRVYRADDPIWDIWYPPNGYKCRCTVVSLSAGQVEKRGLMVYDRPPFTLDAGGKVKPMFPDKGFSGNPAKVTWKPDLSRFSPELRKIYSSRARK